MKDIAIVYWNHAHVQHPCHLVYTALSQQDIKPLFHRVPIHQLSLWLFLNQNSSIVVGPFLYPSEGLDDIGDVIKWSFFLFVLGISLATAVLPHRSRNNTELSPKNSRTLQKIWQTKSGPTGTNADATPPGKLKVLWQYSRRHLAADTGVTPQADWRYLASTSGDSWQ